MPAWGVFLPCMFIATWWAGAAVSRPGHHRELRCTALRPSHASIQPRACEVSFTDAQSKPGTSYALPGQKPRDSGRAVQCAEGLGDTPALLLKPPCAEAGQALQPAAAPAKPSTLAGHPLHHCTTAPSPPCRASQVDHSQDSLPDAEQPLLGNGHANGSPVENERPSSLNKGGHSPASSHGHKHPSQVGAGGLFVGKNLPAGRKAEEFLSPSVGPGFKGNDDVHTLFLTRFVSCNSGPSLSMELAPQP